MDRYEYKTKVDEIKDLMRQGRQQEAVDIVDAMNWNRIHNVNALLSASSIYQEVGRLQDSKELLLLAHERSPIGRMIIYHLALVSIQLHELEEAEEYYKEFVEIAPHDSLKYIIKYRLNKAKGVDNNTLIGILEELRDREFLEEWSYELAYLYHKTAQVDKCIDLCDEIILWFGDGPFVERALELKMLYQPLDKTQEDKYRQFQQRKDGITEIRANEYLGSGEIIPRTITIPEIELPSERFNTVNLQAEIKKNIDEIMKATEAGEVSENMENIKMLVEEIPYLQVNDENSVANTSVEPDNSLMDTFQEFLEEEYDGQMSLFVPEGSNTEEQVRGQMTIEDVMAEWEKTKRAAEAALENAKQKEFETTKAQALKEAAQIMDRLEDAIPKLDAGVSPADLLKEEYLAQEPAEEETDHPKEIMKEKQASVATEDAKEQKGTEARPAFRIPKVAPEGVVQGIGLEIPVIRPEEAREMAKEGCIPLPHTSNTIELNLTKEWRPPRLGTEPPASESIVKEDGMVDYKKASEIVADVNQMLQKEIDKLYQEFEEGNIQQTEEDQENLELSGEPEPQDVSENVSEDIPEDIPEEISEIELQLQNELMAQMEAEEEDEDDLPQIEHVVLEPEEVAGLLDEKVLENAISDEISVMSLTQEEKDIFSYFIPVKGMESSICQALTGARQRLAHADNSGSGNIIIQGSRGSGKTMLASSLIKVLQKEIGRPNQKIGKIDGDKLNEKDIPALFHKISGGCLIIEKAGEISKQTAVSLSLLMENDTSGILMILEDTKLGIERVMGGSLEFAKKFTEKITIPVFTIDELVVFGKTYAREAGFVVDELGVLAMYNRINLIQRMDRPTSLLEVKDIMDEAMDRASGSGLRAMFGRIGTKRYDEDGNLILRERDFEI